MTATETIAETLDRHDARGYSCSCGADLNDVRRHVAEAVVAAVRAMSPEEQADLIGGEAEGDRCPDCHGIPGHRLADGSRSGRETRVVGPWVEVQP